MRIVFVVDSWSQGNGCIVATHRLVHELKGRGHDIAIVCTKGKESVNYDGDVYHVGGFYLPGMKEAMVTMDFQFAKGDKKVLKQAFEGADLIQIQLPYFVCPPVVRLANKMNIPVLGACHVQSQNMTGAMGKDSKMLDFFFNTWFNYNLFNRVDAVHCPSAFAADLIKSKGSKAHYRVVSNGIPHEFVPMQSPQRPDFFEDKFVLINVGRHTFEKKQEMMIDAVLNSKYKDDIKLLICGKGETTEHLRERGEELPVEPFIEYITEEEKLLYLNTADMYLHASVVELESLSCLEAIGCGLPCLIDDAPNSATSQFAMDDRFLFASDNLAELTEKIDYWYENRDTLPTVREDILEMATHYRMDHCIDSMEELYSDMIAYNNGDTSVFTKGEKKICYYEG